MIEINFQTIKYVKMNFYFFEQIPKLAQRSIGKQDGVHTGTHGATLMAGNWALSEMPEKHPRKNLKLKFIY